MSDNIAIGVIVVILIMAIISGIKNPDSLKNAFNQNPQETATKDEKPPQKSKEEIEYELYNTQRKVDEIQTEINKQEEAKKWSIYKDKIYFSGGYGYTADSEYVEITANSNNKETIKITGWTLTSTTTGNTAKIPQSTSLYFSGNINSEEDVYLAPGEKAYIVTGKSPIGYGIKVNKCSGYLSQNSNFSPSLWTSCPSARYEDLSSIPRTIPNENCFDLIDSFPTCRTQQTPLSNAYSSECQNFIYQKMTYSNCINVHKGDKDFWQKEWRIYLKRSERLWRDRRDTIILYDEVGKPVGKIMR